MSPVDCAILSERWLFLCDVQPSVVHIIHHAYKSNKIYTMETNCTRLFSCTTQYAELHYVKKLAIVQEILVDLLELLVYQDCWNVLCALLLVFLGALR